MKGYAVEYCTPYKAIGRVFVPADMYIAFLTCIGDQKGEITKAVLTETIPENTPVLDAASFGWVAIVGNSADGKRIFISDTEFNEVVRKIRTQRTSLTLLHWTNNVISELDNPVLEGSGVQL